MSADGFLKNSGELIKTDIKGKNSQKFHAGLAPEASPSQKLAATSLNPAPFCFLNIYKPKGITSFDVIFKLRKRFGIKKIGHSGTLDPLADGVMQVAVGNATRLLDYLGSDKTYHAGIKFGWSSTTGDAEGEILPAPIPKFTKDELLDALNSMTGKIEQIPPVYSAIKVNGKKLCDLARKNAAADIEIPKRIVTIYKAKLLSSHAIPFQSLSCCHIPSQPLPCQPKVTEKIPETAEEKPKATERNFINTFSNNKKQENKKQDNEMQISEIEVEISCSKGTYIRSFARDLAQKLGTDAYLIALTRTKAGNFEIKDSVKIEDADLGRDGILPHLALENETYCLNEDEYKLVLNGVSFMPVAEKLPSVCKNMFKLSPGESCQSSPALELRQQAQSKKTPEFPICKISAPENPASIPPPLTLLYKNNLVSIAVLSDNKIVCKKVFKQPG